MFGAHVSCAEGLWFESNYLYFTLTPVSMLTTVESFHPDILLLIQTNTLYFLELKVGFETKKENNSDRKATKYCSLIKGLSLSFSYIKDTFVNPSMGAIGAMGSSSNSLLSLLNDLHFDKTIQKRIIKKTMNISIRSTSYIFCR